MKFTYDTFSGNEICVVWGLAVWLWFWFVWSIYLWHTYFYVKSSFQFERRWRTFKIRCTKKHSAFIITVEWGPNCKIENVGGTLSILSFTATIHILLIWGMDRKITFSWLCYGSYLFCTFSRRQLKAVEGSSRWSIWTFPDGLIWSRWISPISIHSKL